MNLNIKKHPMTWEDKEASLQGVGANALWNGPFDTTALPKGKGWSAGKDGIVFNNIKPEYNAQPITQRAKPKFNI
jgi:hypothetical protein